VCDTNGRSTPAKESAQGWYTLGFRDDLKTAGTRTYQSHALEMAELDREVDHPILYTVTKAESERAAAFYADAGILDTDFCLGINTGSSPRWPAKRWPQDRIAALIKKAASDHPDWRILLFGGPEEKGTHEYYQSLAPESVLDTGTGNSLRDFAARLARTNVLITGDTLALHLGLALGCKIVGLFAPTADHEIEVYGRGVHLRPGSETCHMCYRPDCPNGNECMNTISEVQVLEAVAGLK
jgi:heptosyltransferase-2